MTRSLRVLAPRFVIVSLALGALGVAACSDDEAAPGPNSPSGTSDAGRDTGAKDSGNGNDASVDAKTDAPVDACADGGCAPATGCGLFPTAAFCDDFDNADALMPNRTKWDFLEPSEQPVLTLSTVKTVSAPNSLLSRVVDKDTPGAKFAKTITKAGFTEVTWSYDVYFDSIGTDDGFFLDDFQFTDVAGPDTFGFRLVMFAAAGQIRELKVEHNQNAIGGPYVIEPALAPDAVSLGKWHHFEQKVKFTFDDADGGDAGGNKVAYSLKIDNGASPAFQREYPGTSRAQTAFARIAGMPLIFRKDLSAGLRIHWDNHVLEMK